ncbi:MAG: hypothetical protein ACI37Q_07425 [Candidatus Gastranaerophilaceae bacterium]
MRKLQIISLAIIASTCIGISFNKVNSQTIPTLPYSSTAPQTIYQDVNALAVVANPSKYLRRNIRIRAKFDKFATLGLDYAPAMRSSDKYISFLIQRPDITNHNIPLSELKIFLKKEVAEKHIDMDAGDEVEFTGRVFSTALGDAWMDVDEFKVINKINKNNKTSKQY